MSESEFQPQQRLHPMSWLFGLLTFIRQFIFPLIAAAVFGSKNGMPVWLALAVVPMLGAALCKQYFYRYGLGPRGLVVSDGVLSRNVRLIDYPRIENIDTERGVLHRLLGVAEVRVETSTGGKPEALIQVLSLQAVDELRREIFALRSDRVDKPAEQEREEVLLHLPPGEVVRYGLIDNRGMVIVAGLVGLLYEMGIVDYGGEIAKRWLSLWFFGDFIQRGLVLQLSFAFVALTLALVLLRMFSIAVAFLQLYDFTLSRVGADLRARYGLLTRVALTLRLPRIQAVHQTQSVLHRLLGRVSLRVDLAGDGAGSEQSQEARSQVRWLAPVAMPAQAEGLIRVALPDIEPIDQPHWQGLAAGAWVRIFRKSVVWWTFLAVAAGIAFQTYLALTVIAVGVPASWRYATVYVRYTRWALQRDALLFRSGWLTRKLVIVPRNRVQTVHREASPFDRRHNMTSVAIDTAGGSRGEAIRIPYLDNIVAAQLAAALYTSAALVAPPPAAIDEKANTLA